MSEILYDNGEDRLFQALEAVHIEPEVAKVFADIQTYNQLLATEPVNSDEINIIMNEIDELWSPLLGTKATFSGMAAFKDEEHPTYSTAIKAFHEEEEVTFLGVQPVERLGDDDEDAEQYYSLAIAVSRTGRDDNGEPYSISGVAYIEDIAELELKERISAERARYVLENYEPELLYDIEIALSKTEHHEGEGLVELGDLHYDPAAHTDLESGQIVLALNRYVQEMIQLDETMKAYDVKLDGSVWQTREDKDPRATPPLKYRTLMIVEGFSWVMSPDEGNYTFVPSILAKLQGDDLDEQGAPMVIPLASAKYCVPLRYQYYQNP